MLLPSKSSSILSESATELGRLKGEYDGRTSTQVTRVLSRDFAGSCMVVRSNVVDVSLLIIHLFVRLFVCMQCICDAQRF
jgi:hypothetical protein